MPSSALRQVRVCRAIDIWRVGHSGKVKISLTRPAGHIPAVPSPDRTYCAVAPLILPGKEVAS